VGKELIFLKAATQRFSYYFLIAAVRISSLPLICMRSLMIDPIFAAIEQHRGALAAYIATGWVEEDHGERALKLADKLLEAIARTVPTTLSGIAALLDYVDELEAMKSSTYCNQWPDWFEGTLRRTIRVAIGDGIAA
jgi:hypothetical protein